MAQLWCTRTKVPQVEFVQCRVAEDIAKPTNITFRTPDLILYACAGHERQGDEVSREVETAELKIVVSSL